MSDKMNREDTETLRLTAPVSFVFVYVKTMTTLIFPEMTIYSGSRTLWLPMCTLFPTRLPPVGTGQMQIPIMTGLYSGMSGTDLLLNPQNVVLGGFYGLPE